MSYVIQASPLTRIFLEEHHDACLADPSILAKPAKFKIEIPRPCGAITLWHNVPTMAASLIAKNKNRLVSDDEIAPLVEWLTNEANPETDIYGVVAVPIETNVADAIMALLYDEKGAGKQEKLLAEIKKKMAASVSSSRDRADARVLRQCGKMYDMVRQTVQTMKKDGKGVYAPSYAEALAMDVLKDQISIRRKPNAKAQEIFERATSDIRDISGEAGAV